MAKTGAGLIMEDNQLSDGHEFGQSTDCGIIGADDRISALPDELLSYILSLLPPDEAIATSILSKRWKNNLWASRPSLDFAYCNTLRRKDKVTYIQTVNKILGIYEGPKLHNFRIVYPLEGDSSSHIGDWISFAVTKGVSWLELNFLSYPSRAYPNNYHIAENVFQKQYSTDPLHASSPIVKDRFDSLRVLCLRSLNLSDEVFRLILSSCSSLENFLLMYICGLIHAKSAAPHMKLRSLELYHCQDLARLELYAPNLVSFKYQGENRTLCIRDSPKLSKLSVLTFREDMGNSSIYSSGKAFISQFSSYVPKLESLIITAHLFKDMSVFRELPIFDNLKHLVVNVTSVSYIQFGCHGAASIMRASPYLQQLELNLPSVYTKQKLARKFSSLSPYQNLKEFKLSGFQGDAITMEFVTFVVENAVGLQKIDITGFGRSWNGDYLKVNYFCSERAARRCKTFKGQLRERLRRSTQLILHDQ